MGDQGVRAIVHPRESQTAFVQMSVRAKVRRRWKSHIPRPVGAERNGI